MKYFYILIASGFGSGFSPLAPGTWGTLAGCVLLGALYHLNWVDSGLSLIILTAGISIIGYWCINRLPDHWAHDDQRIVIDEVLGLFVTMIFIPISVKTLFFAFLLFRVFDIWKPLGIRKFDNLKSNMSVIVDDLLAGVYANFALRGLILLLSFYELW